MDLSESKWVLLTFPNAISHSNSFSGTANCDRNIQLRFTALLLFIYGPFNYPRIKDGHYLSQSTDDMLMKKLKWGITLMWKIAVSISTPHKQSKSNRHRLKFDFNPLSTSVALI